MAVEACRGAVSLMLSSFPASRDRIKVRISAHCRRAYHRQHPPAPSVLSLRNPPNTRSHLRTPMSLSPAPCGSREPVQRETNALHPHIAPARRTAQPGPVESPAPPLPPLPIPLSIGSRATTRHPEPAAMERELGGEVSLRIPPNTPARTPAHPCPCPQSPGLAGACRARDERSSPSHRPTPCPLILSLSKDPPLPPIRPS